MGKEKGVLGNMNENENNEVMVHSRGGPEPIPPEKMQENGTGPKALKIHPTQNGRGRYPPLHRVAKHTEPQIRFTIQNDHANPEAIPLPSYEESQQLPPAASPY